MDAVVDLRLRVCQFPLEGVLSQADLRRKSAATRHRGPAVTCRWRLLGRRRHSSRCRQDEQHGQTGTATCAARQKINPYNGEVVRSQIFQHFEGNDPP